MNLSAYDYSEYERYKAAKTAPPPVPGLQTTRPPAPPAYGTDHRSSFDRQIRESNEWSTSSSDIGMGSRVKGRASAPVPTDQYASALLAQQAEKAQRQRRQADDEGRTTAGWQNPFPGMSQEKVKMFSARSKAPVPMTKTEYAAMLKEQMLEQQQHRQQQQLQEKDPFVQTTTVRRGSDAQTYEAPPAYPPSGYEPRRTSTSITDTCVSSGRYTHSAATGHDLYRTLIANGSDEEAPQRPSSMSRGRSDAPPPAALQASAFPPDAVVDKVRNLIKARGDHGFSAIRRSFKVIDRDGSGALNTDEFKWGLFDFGLKLTDADLAALVRSFDTNRDGSVGLQEFMTAIRGEINDRRMGFINMAYNIMDRNRDGTVTLEDISAFYNVDWHPKVISKQMTKEQAMMEFLNSWDRTPDGTLTKEDFITYYKDLSAAIDDDDYFELMMRNAWHISGGQGWCANSSNLRVLVVHYDDSQEVVEIKNDMGLDPRNTSQIRAELTKQGITNVKRVSVSDGI